MLGQSEFRLRKAIDGRVFYQSTLVKSGCLKDWNDSVSFMQSVISIAFTNYNCTSISNRYRVRDHCQAAREAGIFAHKIAHVEGEGGRRFSKVSQSGGREGGDHYHIVRQIAPSGKITKSFKEADPERGNPAHASSVYILNKRTTGKKPILLLYSIK